MLLVARIERGFTFLGYWIAQRGVTGVAPSTWEAFRERVARLYGQNAPQEEVQRRIGQYVLEVERCCPNKQIAVLIPELVQRRWLSPSAAQ